MELRTEANMHNRGIRLERSGENPILGKNPENHWEAGSVFNPNVLYDNGVYRMLYRATNDIQTKKEGGYVSSIGYAESTDGIHFKRFSTPLLSPTEEYEMGLGCEDGRVTKIGNKYFLYYTAVNGTGDQKQVRIALATSEDFVHWEKHGIVGPSGSRSKAAILFPEAVNGQYVMFYTWRADRPESTIMQARFNSLEEVVKPPPGFMSENLENYDYNAVFLPPPKTFRGAEVGAVPIKTNRGWLFIFCGANTSDHEEWTINAALLDLHDPGKVLATTEKPILSPETEYEKGGVVKNVTFPSGAVTVGKEVFVYYGRGDQGCCLATCSLQELLEHLLQKT